MKAELASQFRVAGLVRSPDREGALAHFDPDRGFAFCARSTMGPADVIDPAIWVKEKISLALSSPGDASDAPLRRVIGAIRALHGELMARPEKERPWVSVLVLLLIGEDAVAVSAGDCPCFRFRSGLLSRLGRGEASADAGAPRGALGSEPQVRIEIVPLRPPPGDLYVLSTRQLREGELAVLARDLAMARDGAQLLRAGVEGASDRGRIAIRILEPLESESIVEAAESLESVVEPFHDETAEATPEEAELVGGAADWGGSLRTEPLRAEPSPREPLRIDPVLPPRGDDWRSGELIRGGLGDLDRDEEEPEAIEPEEIDLESIEVPDVGAAYESAAPVETAGFPESGGFVEAELPATESPAADAPATEPEFPAERTEPLESSSVFDSWERPAGDAERRNAPQRPARPGTLAPVGEERPWYEPLALSAGGALAIVALALLVRSLLPGIVGANRNRGAEPRVVAGATGLADIFSDPPGATVRVDGVTLDGKTPLAGVSLDAGLHRVELDWGPWGAWRDTVEITPGSRLTVHPALFGTATLRSSDPSRVLDVYMDGLYVGTTPITLPQVVVGRHLVRFGGPGLTTSAQEVEVLRDRPVELLGNPGPIPEKGKVTIRTAILGDSGFEPGRGDPYWIDGLARGATPATVDLNPGTHSVRVARRGFPPQVTVLEVKAGGEHFVTAEFGARSEEPLRFDPPEAVDVSNPMPLTIALPTTEWDPSMALWLYAAAPGGSFQAKRMTRLEEGTRTFAALLPPEVLRSSARQVRFYFKATGTAGREIYSEIYTVPVRQ
jgi:PEGA domain-containing protein